VQIARAVFLTDWKPFTMHKKWCQRTTGSRTKSGCRTMLNREHTISNKIDSNILTGLREPAMTWNWWSHRIFHSPRYSHAMLISACSCFRDELSSASTSAKHTTIYSSRSAKTKKTQIPSRDSFVNSIYQQHTRVNECSGSGTNSPGDRCIS